jgi:hypothetical protein
LALAFFWVVYCVATLAFDCIPDFTGRRFCLLLFLGLLGCVVTWITYLSLELSYAPVFHVVLPPRLEIPCMSSREPWDGRSWEPERGPSSRPLSRKGLP